MEILDSGKDKVKKICDTLKKQTLEPAKQEAKALLEQATKDAERIVKRAKEEAKEIYEDHKKKMAQEKKAFHSSLTLASVQTMELLRQEIEDNLFSKHISKLFTSETIKVEVIAEFIDVVLDLLKKEGLDAHVEALLPQAISKEQVAKRLAKQSMEILGEKGLALSSITGGTRVKVVDRHLVLEISDQSLRELFIRFIRDDFRALLFDVKSM